MVSDQDLEDAHGLLALEHENPSSLETESEAFKRNLPSGIMGFIASVLMAWMPWWSRSRKYKDNVKD